MLIINKGIEIDSEIISTGMFVMVLTLIESPVIPPGVSKKGEKKNLTAKAVSIQAMLSITKSVIFSFIIFN